MCAFYVTTMGDGHNNYLYKLITGVYAKALNIIGMIMSNLQLLIKTELRSITCKVRNGKLFTDIPYYIEIDLI